MIMETIWPAIETFTVSAVLLYGICKFIHWCFSPPKEALNDGAVEYDHWSHLAEERRTGL